MIVLVHGGGRPPAEAWPGLTEQPGTMVARLEPGAGMAAWVRTIQDAMAGDDVLVAHSLGAVPAVLASATRRPRRLVLAEPALYDVARGDPAIERHIARAASPASLGMRSLTTPVPWGHRLRADAIAGIDTVVATGAWLDEYEAIAAALVAAGARHVVLEGHQHRPQDDPRFADLVR